MTEIDLPQLIQPPPVATTDVSVLPCKCVCLRYSAALGNGVPSQEKHNFIPYEKKFIGEKKTSPSAPRLRSFPQFLSPSFNVYLFGLLRFTFLRSLASRLPKRPQDPDVDRGTGDE